MISKKTINAVDLCVLLANLRDGGYQTSQDLSPRLGLSISYLETILKSLKEAGIVVSMKGPGGGYMIAGDVSLISIWDIASVFEKTLADAAPDSEATVFDAYESELEQVVMTTLRSFTLADFVDFSSTAVNAYTEVLGRFKFKPLPMPFVPKAPNSVFQLGMCS